MLALRNSKTASELDDLSSQVGSRLLELPEIGTSRIISTYLHTGSEVRTRRIVEWALSKGKRVIIPISDRANKQLAFSEILDPERELGKGTYGILEPKEEFRRPVPLEQADVVLVPGVAWDPSGYRIGYGVGYYDRSINRLRRPVTKIGLSFEFQLVPRIPRTQFDRCVNKLVTDRRVINTHCE